MTCIVGLLDSGKVWIGGDSAGVSAGYAAVGCGEAYALGSLYATEGQVGPPPHGLDPESRIYIALEAAAKFSGGVNAPFVVKSL